MTELAFSRSVSLIILNFLLFVLYGVDTVKIKTRHKLDFNDACVIVLRFMHLWIKPILVFHISH